MPPPPMLMGLMGHDDDDDEHEIEDPFEIIRELEKRRRIPMGGPFGASPQPHVEVIRANPIPIQVQPRIVHISEAAADSGVDHHDL